ncbi:MAG TPA: nucleotidyl transferase AbiEii/AbiGii toxin family protein [Bacteroidales bacterium]|jgi:hypothetical protein|nr:nucleotidyl transferase AbiEii/AbiGii toxin family protein [Bacteroidales bacterium]
MEPLDIGAWIESSETVSIKEFRQAVHTVIVAVSRSPFLQTNMVMKGGVLLAIRFKSSRLTQDIDFSSSELFSGFDKTKLLEDLGDRLALAGEELPYGLACSIQSHEVKPPNEEASFPTLTIRVGHAYKGTPKHKRLLNGACPDILKIDLSFNEYNYAIDTLDMVDAGSIKAYSLVDLVSEKYRAIVQQKDRNRIRRQDAYDIYWLLINGYINDVSMKAQILSSLKTKAKHRNLVVDKFSLREEEIIRRSELEYATLAQEVEGELPPFEEVYGVTRDYYESLPWESSGQKIIKN